MVDDALDDVGWVWKWNQKFSPGRQGPALVIFHDGGGAKPRYSRTQLDWL